jgi:putative ABC transport system permease protein
MLKKHFLIAWRNIKRYKGYSFINIFGLAVGIACCLLIMIWVQNELSYDRFHKKGGRIFRLVNALTLNGQTRTGPGASAMMGPALLQSFPEVEQSVRIVPGTSTIIKHDTKEFREDRILFADPSIFSVFTFPLVVGHSSSALSAPYSVVISERTARKYFDRESPLGQILKFGDGHTYTVTGVIRDTPRNSHLAFDILCSFSTWIAENKQMAEIWGALGTFTYVLLAPGTDNPSFQAKTNRLSNEKIGPLLKRVGGSLTFSLQALKNIHLHSGFESDIATTNDVMTITLFSGIALFILFIACINFINLTTARYANRALEVGLKKTLGATRGSLIRQFLAETFVVTMLAMALACLFTALALPWLNSICGQEFSYAILSQPSFLIIMVVFTILIGVLAGSYPAFHLSSFAPMQTLKGTLKAGAGGAAFRKILVVGQFSISIALIIGTLTIVRQLDYLKNKHLGFDREQVVVIPLPREKNIPLATVRNEFAAVPGVISAAVSSAVPGFGIKMRNYLPEGRTDQEGLLMLLMDADDRFLDTLGMKIVRGRNFSQTMTSDPGEAILINETAVARLNWQDPLGKTISWAAPGTDGKPVRFKKKIIGVVKDFNTRSLHQQIEPLVMSNAPEDFNTLSLRFTGRQTSEIMARLRGKWGRIFPEMTFDSFFLDESFARLYPAEEQLNKIITSFAFLAIFISCLGLFGLAAHMTEKRSKEVGIRKALGASISRIVFLLSREFAKWVLIANIVAWPLAYLLLQKWLDGFAYRTTIVFATFALSGAASLLIALLTVSFQAIRTARTNPVQALRYE